VQQDVSQIVTLFKLATEFRADFARPKNVPPRHVQNLGEATKQPCIHRVLNMQQPHEIPAAWPTMVEKCNTKTSYICSCQTIRVLGTKLSRHLSYESFRYMVWHGLYMWRAYVDGISASSWLLLVLLLERSSCGNTKHGSDTVCHLVTGEGGLGCWNMRQKRVRGICTSTYLP